MKKLILILAILFVAVPANANPTTLGQLAVYVTTNTDVDTSAEAIIASTETTAPTACDEMIVCNGANPISGGGDVIRVLQSSTTLSGTLGGVATVGYPLYPVSTSGPTCLTVKAFTNSKGLKSSPNPRQIYAAGTANNNQATLTCTRY
jgi:hypothetical protein